MILRTENLKTRLNFEIQNRLHETKHILKQNLHGNIDCTPPVTKHHPNIYLGCRAETGKASTTYYRDAWRDSSIPGMAM
jgi:hypothetical protein